MVSSRWQGLGDSEEVVSFVVASVVKGMPSEIQIVRPDTRRKILGAGKALRRGPKRSHRPSSKFMRGLVGRSNGGRGGLPRGDQRVRVFRVTVRLRTVSLAGFLRARITRAPGWLSTLVISSTGTGWSKSFAR